MIRSCIPGTLCILGAMTASGQATTDAPSRANEPYQGAWKAEEEQREAGIWKALSEKEPSNAAAHYNWFVSERNAALARNEGELPEAEKKKLDAIADDLKKTAPNSFEAHMADFHLTFPARSSFPSLNAATALDPKRPELLGPLLGKAIMEGNESAITNACEQLDSRGGVSQALLDVATDLLLSIDKDGIVFTNGEMDCYPTLVRQRVFGMRKDVLVIDQRLLSDEAYRQRMWAQARASGKPPGTPQAFIRNLLDATTRPVFLALSLDPDLAASMENELYATGIALRFSHQRVENIDLLAERWPRMNKNLYAGPLSTNYLLPAIVLLKHYRTTGNEEQAALLEHEVRAMAAALGQTRRLTEIGVLEH